VVFARDGFQCIRCGKRDRLQWCHVYSRRYRSLRWNLLNSMTLCAGDHLWWHHRPLDAMAWWREKVGPDKADRLSLAARVAGAAKLDLVAVRIFLQMELDRCS
jgi:5-methylcytosine-specific restriction endonuclease McrA